MQYMLHLSKILASINFAKNLLDLIEKDYLSLVSLCCSLVPLLELPYRNICSLLSIYTTKSSIKGQHTTVKKLCERTHSEPRTIPMHVVRFVVLPHPNK